MTNSKSTKRALISSIIALAMCFSMLVGTTFAWFTDSVTSANNIIASGNLDVKLEYSRDFTTWTEVNETTEIFTKEAKWEPGYTDVVYFKVSNLGSLALKYTFGINLIDEKEGKNAAGETFKLSDYIEYDVIDIDQTAGKYASREAALAAVDNATVISNAFAKNSYINAGEPEHYVALVIYMPESVGNVANHNGTDIPEIKFGISVHATQNVDEADGFNNEYDKDAWVEGMAVMSAEDLQAALNNGATEITLAGDIELSEPIVIPAAATTYSMRNVTPVTIDLNGKTITAGDDGYAIHNALGNTVVITDTSDNGEIIGVVYNEGSTMIIEDGIFTAKADGKWVLLNSKGSLTVNGGTVNGGSSYPIYSYDDGHELVINDVTVNGIFGCINAYSAGSVAVNGGEFYMTGVEGKTSHMIYISGTTTLTINDGIFRKLAGISMSGTGGGGICSASNAEININGGSFKGDYRDLYVWSESSKITVSGGAFTFDPTAEGAKLADGYSAVNTNGAYTVLKGDVAAGDNASLNDALANGESNIALGAGNFTMPGVTGDITLSGTADTVIQLTTSTADNVTLNGVTVVAGSYQGIQHSNTVVYENCVIKGTQFLYANKVVFRNCTIDLSETADYIWTYSAKDVEFIDCVFNTKGKAILIYHEGPDTVTNITVNNCTFNATACEDKAAIEIGSSISINGHYTLTTENNVYDSENFTGEWRIKNSAEENVTVNGVTYTWVADGLYKDTDKAYYVYDANGLEKLNAMMNDDSAGKNVVVNLLNDIDFAGKTWTPVDSHIDLGFYLKEINGNGHTISNLTVNGQAMFTRFSCGAGNDVVIKDITFDNATVNNGGINTAIIVGHTYNNVLLDNVDVKNSTITGGYKVAPLIGTVYNESSSTITATLKNCDVESTVVTAISYDFCTTGMVAFVYADDNDTVEFENCTVTDVQIFAPNAYTAHAWVYTTGSETLFNEVEGVTVTDCTFENK